jgi:hypothetical protein
LRAHDTRKAQVADLQVVMRIDEHVLRFDVAVEHAVRMEVLQPYRELNEVIPQCFFLKGLAAKNNNIKILKNKYKNKNKNKKYVYVRKT